MSKEISEIEDMVVLGPGAVLAEAREELGLTIEDVADKLNFRISLVKDIEADIFDKSLSDTFNRGYLKNYAKLVNITNDEIIGLYENLNIAQENQTQMQSFSNSTTKEAHNSMLMWITYLILIVFIGLTVMWWLQDDKTAALQEELTVVTIERELSEEQDLSIDKAPPLPSLDANNISVENNLPASVQEQPTLTQEPDVVKEVQVETPQLLSTSSSSESISDGVQLSKMVFTFSGDCWVNIHDASGERIAWGVKKAGYVMSIEGQAPLKLTIGKPELVEINFDGESVDMSGFPEGHVAKFSLPILSQS